MKKTFLIIAVLWCGMNYAQQNIPTSNLNATTDKSIGDLTSTLEKLKLHEGKNQVFSALDHSYTVYAIVDKELNISSMEVQNALHVSLPVKYKNITEATAKKASKPKTVKVCKEFCFPDGNNTTICGWYCGDVKK
jgi:hypothetical protein